MESETEELFGAPAPPGGWPPPSLAREVRLTLIAVPVLGLVAGGTLYAGTFAMPASWAYLVTAALYLHLRGALLTRSGELWRPKPKVAARFVVWGTLPAWVGAAAVAVLTAAELRDDVARCDGADTLTVWTWLAPAVAVAAFIAGSAVVMFGAVRGLDRHRDASGWARALVVTPAAFTLIATVIAIATEEPQVLVWAGIPCAAGTAIGWRTWRWSTAYRDGAEA